MDAYRTLAAPKSHEIDKIKGSRFIGYAQPIGDAQQARAAIDEVRREHPGANHHALAWRLRSGLERFSVDGEPFGSAGTPILRQIDGHDVTDVVVVVVRYFGGTKLGVGGLVRAYGQAAANVLDRSDIIEIIPTERVTLVFPYTLSNVVNRILASTGLRPIEEAYEEETRFVLDVPTSQSDSLISEVRERSGDRVRIERKSSEP